MNNYKSINGDLLELARAGEFDVIVHGCNCYRAMSGGIAAQIAEQFPQAETADNLTGFKDKKKLGDYSIANGVNDHNNKFYILNAYTQFTPGRDFQMRHLKKVLKKISAVWGHTRIAFPKIGCGIGGGHWPDVESMIKEFAKSNPTIQVTIVNYQS